jgi:hypothetical protein
MMPRLSRSTKLMSFGILLSLGWFVFESCECANTKQQDFPDRWVTCIGNKPTLMEYSDNNPFQVSQDPVRNFDPSEWDCTNPNSPNYKGSEKSVPFKVSGPGGPAPGAIKGHATTPLAAYIPQQLRDLPFLPDIPPSPAAPACQASFPDVFATNHVSAVVTRISTCPFAIKAVIPVVTRPLQVDITPDGSTALVTSFDNAVNFIDLATNEVTYTLMTDSNTNPHGLAISPDGKRAYITSFQSIELGSAGAGPDFANEIDPGDHTHHHLPSGRDAYT